jgi:hypothetical protein
MTLPAPPESAADDLNVEHWLKESFEVAEQTASGTSGSGISLSG